MASKDAAVGGQAVLEGVMMRGVRHWAVAVRNPPPEGAPDDALGEITVEVTAFESVLKRHRLLRLPIVRGVVALGESLSIGMKALGTSANAQLDEDDGEIGKGASVGTMVLALSFAIGLFFLLPAAATKVLDPGDGLVFVLVEKVVRLSIFLGYLYFVFRLPDLKRVTQYHGAEHKVIACHEAGLELTPEHAQRFSRLHPRCGTSFLLIVMLIPVFVLAPLGQPAWWLLILSRIVAVPIVAGISFEVLKWFGRNRTRPWARTLMWPGLQLQRLTTAQPDAAQLAVAVAALQAVLDREPAESVAEADAIALEVAA